MPAQAGNCSFEARGFSPVKLRSVTKHGGSPVNLYI